MNVLKHKKLNYLLSHWPSGEIRTSRWLQEHGYYKQLLKAYCDNGWLKRVGKGAYTRLNDELTWVAAVKTLQSEQPIHVGGLTALDWYGVSQYVKLDNSQSTFYLYRSTEQKVRLPRWFEEHFSQGALIRKKVFDSLLGLSLNTLENTEVMMASPERAILEVLSVVPQKITVSHASELMESLDRLRADVMQLLLEECFSIKAKRLFLCLAERHNLSCFQELTLKDLEIGSGKMIIAGGGDYQAKWRLSLPKENGDFA